MFYRRKIILALLEVFEGKLEKIYLQKILFLFSQRQQNPEYEFVPYKYGCFSYSVNADLFTMVKKEYLNEDEDNYIINKKGAYLKSLKEQDRKILLEVKNLYGKLSTNALIKHTYVNFPYWASNSLIAKDILTLEQLQKVENFKVHDDEIILYTIGYEGISLEEYLNRLIKNGVKLLVDVRKNPLSMKYGFSKTLLKRFCENLGINYLHFPEVGIDSSQRQTLNNQDDYDTLFDSYRENLGETLPTQNKILSLLLENKRIALTCFEADICQCHRKHLAEAIQNLPNFTYQTKHI